MSSPAHIFPDLWTLDDTDLHSCAFLWFHLGEWRPCIANQVLSVSDVMYVCMYVRVGLYFLDIILDIALIQHLPKLGKIGRTVLWPAADE